MILSVCEHDIIQSFNFQRVQTYIAATAGNVQPPEGSPAKTIYISGCNGSLAVPVPHISFDNEDVLHKRGVLCLAFLSKYIWIPDGIIDIRRHKCISPKGGHVVLSRALPLQSPRSIGALYASAVGLTEKHLIFLYPLFRMETSNHQGTVSFHH